MSVFQRVEVARITEKQILIYERPVEPLPRSERQRQNEENLTRGDYNGFMSPKTKSQVKKYLSTWIEAALTLRKHSSSELNCKIPYLTFVTLTLPSKQLHNDKEIKRSVFVPFVQTLRRKFKIDHYYWRAEPQKNGNIHFHLIVDGFIEWQKLRDEWNSKLNTLDYIDNFEKLHGHRNPNSTDIHKFKAIKNPAAYVIKYMTKTDGYRKIDGRIHGCSDTIRNLKPYTVEIDNETSNLIIDAIEQADSTVIREPNFVIIKGNIGKLINRRYPRVREEIDSYYLKIGKSLYERRVDIEPEIQESVLAIHSKQLVMNLRFNLFGHASHSSKV